MPSGFGLCSILNRVGCCCNLMCFTLDRLPNKDKFVFIRPVIRADISHAPFAALIIAQLTKVSLSLSHCVSQLLTKADCLYQLLTKRQRREEQRGRERETDS